ncbi:hypothetical protein Q1695_015533 [Nippostrongylus brasiliensis]|nr:hypothetical protein Q1695_015533 [Nippostrongylus brasiliensis]
MRESWHETVEDRQSAPALVVDKVSKVWESTGELAVNNFSMNAYTGDVTVLLGHNGAGKSTMYSMICGSTSVTSGSIKVFGRKRSRIIRSGVGFCPQANCIFKYLTVMDHLWFFFKLKGGRGKWEDEANMLLQALKIPGLKNRRAIQLSGGEKRKLCLAMAFIGNSKLVILDEPTAGLDPRSRRDVEEFVMRQKAKRCILLSTHYMDEAEAMGDFVYIMLMGQGICSGTSFFLKQKFSSDYILTIAFTKQPNEEDVSKVEKILKKHVSGAKVENLKAKLMSVALPKREQEGVPKMLASLENQKEELCIDSFGLSLSTLEDVFLRVGQLATKDASVAVELVKDEKNDIQRSCWLQPFQQIRYIFFKRLMYLIFSTSMLIHQVLLPIAILVLFGATSGTSSPTIVPDVSLNLFKTGRFVVFDPYNNTYARNLVEKGMQRYEHIQVVYPEFINGSVEESWPDDYPWAVGGVVLGEENTDNMNNSYHVIFRSTV